MEVQRIESSNAAEWDEFVRSSPASTFYHLFGWKGVIEQSFGHQGYYLAAKSGGRIEGVLPIVHIKSRLFGSILCSMPFMGIGGICAENEDASTCLLNGARRLLQEVQGDYLELRHRKQTNFDLPVKKHKVTMTVQLAQDPETLWNGFKSKHRTAIRRAEKNNLEIKAGKGEYLDAFYAIEATGWRDLGTPFYRKSFFKNVLDAFEDCIDIYVVFWNDQPIATAFNGLFKDEVEGMWTYCLKSHSKLQTNYYLYWQMISQACERGYRQYHLGRSTAHSGASFYKTKWYAEPYQLYWEYLLNKNHHLPNLDAANPKYEKLRNVWKRLPVKVTQVVGPFVAKNIP